MQLKITSTIYVENENTGLDLRALGVKGDAGVLCKQNSEYVGAFGEKDQY